jgi:hypothetical protein
MEKLKALKTTLVSSGPRNTMELCKLSQPYYIKTYNNNGSWLRSLLGKSRLENEFTNLKAFQQHHIPTPPIIAFGHQKQLGKLQEGVLVTLGIHNTLSLADIHKTNRLHSHGSRWLKNVLAQIAKYTATMHRDNFMFSDLKWRNILVSDDAVGTVYFIDCPNGTFVPSWFMWRAIIKDLACLDKVGKYALARTQRLYFYKQYQSITKLTNKDKKRITKILKFFEGRE